MDSLIGLVLATTSIFLTPVAYASSTPTTTPTVVPLPTTTVGLISYYAELYDVSSSSVYSTLRCESKLNPSAIGDGGHSYGIAQIHLPSHPKVTKKQALNKAFAIRWTVKQFAAGRASMWTCARVLGLD